MVGTVVGVIALVQSNGSSGNETQKIPQPKRAVSAPKTELKREPALIPSIMQITSDSKELVKAIILRAQEAVQRLFELDRMKWSVRMIDKIEALQLIVSALLQENK